MVVRAGEFIKRHTSIEGDAVDYASVHLSLDSVHRVTGPAVLTNEDSQLSEQTEVPTHNRYSFEQRSSYDAVEALREYGLGPRSSEEFYYLEEDEIYIIEYAEDVDIPEGHIGLVLPDKSLLQSGATLFTEVWEPNDETPLDGSLRTDCDLLLESDARVGSLVLLETDTTE